ncbi:hypothetical protein [Puniceicoccus vermicola]|uniref:DUF3108 domain-containing protein n=1 Tax=Puniceicoccus vermicola TaxID=388746 RepID=A0A7X1AZT3_9BACT|nr:hypothetical protein [Puniceicoccus vermicola]MBC2602939.1 hypothetical protein [Puniceicoccus vermicola]
MKSFYLILVACAALVQVSAQEQTIEVRSLALSRNDQLPEVFLREDAEFHPISFSHYQPSKPVTVSATSPLPLFKRLPMANEGLPPVVARVPLPKDAEDILLLGWMNGERPRYVALANNLTSASARDWLLINTTNRRVAFRLGKDSKPVLVDSGQTLRYEIDVDLNKGAAALAVAETETDGWQIFYSTYLPVFEGSRTMLLFVQDDEKIRVREITSQVE